MFAARAVLAAGAAVALGLTGCSSPSSRNTGGGTDAGTITAQANAVDPAAKGPAAPVPGSRTGGTVTVLAQMTPNTFDPTDIYDNDAGEIAKLLFRTPTQFAIRAGRPTLVPDLTDLGTVSADQLTWTFKMQPGIRYEDGTEVEIEDLAYAVKRSFARDVFPNGPAYQMQYLKDGGTYKGPYTGGADFAGVSTQGADTLLIHLAQPFSDLPFYLTFPMFTPIPQAKDTRQRYRDHPLATGPYMFGEYRAGASLTLQRNRHWDRATDAARHDYPDAWRFEWGGDSIKSQTAVLNGNGDAASSISFDPIDASLIPMIQDGRQAQLVQGQNQCTVMVQLDTRKIPLEVRKAVATAWPYDANFKTEGLNLYVAEPAGTILPPSVPGHQKYPAVAGLAGTGPGDPVAAKAMLAAAGKAGFELSWYYDNSSPESQQVSQVRADALKAAGFTVKTIGVGTADYRAKASDYDAPVNMGQAPPGWCSDWPSGGSWFPVLFETHSIADGTSWGMLRDPELDEEIDAVAKLPAADSTGKWAALDRKVMQMYVAIPRYYAKMAVVQGGNVGTTVGDPTKGMPLLADMYLKS